MSGILVRAAFSLGLRSGVVSYTFVKVPGRFFGVQVIGAVGLEA